MRVRWKPYPSFNIDGEPIVLGAVTDEDMSVLNKILSMPKKKMISYSQGQVMYWAELAQSIMDEANYIPLGHAASIDWLSSQGFSIALTGDEYELLPVSEKELV